MASNDPTREELLSAEVARLHAQIQSIPLLQAQVEQLQAENTALRQEVQNKALQETDVDEERPRKKQKTTQHDVQEQLLALCDEPDVMDQEQVVVARITIVQILPTELLGRALDFLPFSERRVFFIGNHDLWKRVRVEYETKMMVDLIFDLVPTHAFLCRDFSSVCTLNLGPYASDSVLALLSHERAFPQLQHLAMAGSSVTDQGLALLPLNPLRCQKLLSIDITGCLGTTIEAVFLLRDRVANLRNLRRQPSWMDGKTLLPDGTRCIYWADGVRAFYAPNGEIDEILYIQNLLGQSSSVRVVCKIQVVLSSIFEEDEWWQEQLEWTRHAYRYGATVLNLPDTQSVLMASAQKGIFPVQGFPCHEDAQLVRINSRSILNQQREVCARDDPNAYAAVSHRRLVPLDTLMSPHDVMHRCRTQVERAKVVMAGRRPRNDERDLHVSYGGNRDDMPPPYWFQHDD